MSYENRAVGAPFEVAGDSGPPQPVTGLQTLTVAGGLGIVTQAAPTRIINIAFQASELPVEVGPVGATLVIASAANPAGARITSCELLETFASLPVQPATAQLVWYDPASDTCGRTPYNFCNLLTGSTTLVNMNTVDNPAFLLHDINTGNCFRAQATNLCLVSGPWTTQALARNPGSGRFELVPVRSRYQTLTTLAPVSFNVSPVDTKVLFATPLGGVLGTVVLNAPLLPCDPVDIHIKNSATPAGGGGGIRITPGPGVANLDNLPFIFLADVGPAGGMGESVHLVWDAAFNRFQIV